MSQLLLTGLLTFALLCPSPVLAAAGWPDLSQPAPAVGGGSADAAVVVGIESYAFIPPVPGAAANAKAWYDYLTTTRGASPANVKLLLGVDATRGEILDAAVEAAGKAGPDGTLWFVFIGHGAPDKAQNDGLLVGVDAQQKAKSLKKRGLRRGELLKTLVASKAGSIRVVLDACFSGRGQDGSSIAPGLQPLVVAAPISVTDSRMVVLTAARADQFAGALPGARKPAFSYLTLGGLRGWAAEPDGQVTAGGLWNYVKGALSATLRGRHQTPELTGEKTAVVGLSAGEKGPDLAAMAKATAGGGARKEMFRISSPSSVPTVTVPKAYNPDTSGADWRSIDVEALGMYDQAMKHDKSDASPEGKIKVWRELASSAPSFADKAKARAAEWEKYLAELAAAKEAREKRVYAMEEDWSKLKPLLSFDVVSKEDKKRWAKMFVEAYGSICYENPHVFELKEYLPPGSLLANAGSFRWLVQLAEHPLVPGRGLAGLKLGDPEAKMFEVLGKPTEGPKAWVHKGDFRSYFSKYKHDGVELHIGMHGKEGSISANRTIRVFLLKDANTRALSYPHRSKAETFLPRLKNDIGIGTLKGDMIKAMGQSKGGASIYWCDEGGSDDSGETFRYAGVELYLCNWNKRIFEIKIPGD